MTDYKKIIRKACPEGTSDQDLEKIHEILSKKDDFSILKSPGTKKITITRNDTGTMTNFKIKSIYIDPSKGHVSTAGNYAELPLPDDLEAGAKQTEEDIVKDPSFPPAK